MTKYIRIGTAPTCWCGKPSYWLLRTFGSQLAHYCREHGDAVRAAR